MQNPKVCDGETFPYLIMGNNIRKVDGNNGEN